MGGRLQSMGLDLHQKKAVAFYSTATEMLYGSADREFQCRDARYHRQPDRERRRKRPGARGCAASISGEPMTSTIEVANGSEGTCRERHWYRKMLERGLSRRVLPGLLAATHAVSFNRPTAAASKQRILHHWPLAVLNKHVV
jgi:hypothetical protein